MVITLSSLLFLERFLLSVGHLTCLFDNSIIKESVVVSVHETCLCMSEVLPYRAIFANSYVVTDYKKQILR